MLVLIYKNNLDHLLSPDDWFTCSIFDNSFDNYLLGKCVDGQE